MTLLELSREYRAHADALKGRVRELRELLPVLEDPGEALLLAERIHTLQVMWRDTRDLAVLLERYYERGYRRNERYTL